MRNLGARDHHYSHDKTECLHSTDILVYTVVFQLSDCHSICGQSQHPLFQWVESTHYHLSHSSHSRHTNTCSGSFQVWKRKTNFKNLSMRFSYECLCKQNSRAEVNSKTTESLAGPGKRETSCYATAAVTNNAQYRA